MITNDDGFTYSISGNEAEIRLDRCYDPGLHGCRWAEFLSHDLPGSCHEVIIDMGGFNQVDSRLFTGLIQTQRQLTSQGISRITLRNVGPRVRVGLDMLRLSPFFAFQRQATALAAG